MKTTSQQIVVPKGWGFEKWITNNEKYCGKLLFFEKGKKCSWHYHKIKDEVFFVHSGKLLVKYGYIPEDGYTGFTQEIVLERGDSFHVEPLLIHQMTALEETEMFEFSTQHFDEDSYRVIKGD